MAPLTGAGCQSPRGTSHATPSVERVPKGDGPREQGVVARRSWRSRRSLLRLAVAPAVGLVPVLAGIAPTHASALGLDESPGTGATSVSFVAVSGWGFTGTTAVDFGATPALAVDVLDDTHLMAVSPPGTAPVDVSVTTAAGTSTPTSSDVYTYTNPPQLSGLSPPTGPVGGGTTLVITGRFFTGVTSVIVGGKAASFTVNSPTQITAITPSHGKGVVTVVVTTAGGTTPHKSPAAKFTYTAT